jgi:hypothetical protein
MEISDKRSSSGFNFGSIFLIYINDLPKITDNHAKVVIFTDDTSIIVITSNQGGIHTALNKTISGIISCFKVNFLFLNFSETYYLEFRTENCIDATLDIKYFNESIANVPYTSFWVY